MSKDQDFRLRSTRARVKVGTSVMIPSGTEMILCAHAGEEVRKVRLASNWYVEVHGVEPEVLTEEQ